LQPSTPLTASPDGGRVTLERMDGAQNYNSFLGRKFRSHLGKRVLEIGAGIGTITREIEKDRELVLALEIEQHYVDKLTAAFSDKPHVRPYLSDVALADWPTLKAERIDSILLSNVLEHIPDDAGAVRRFREILDPGGRLVIFVPALQALFGSMDRAVGHYRRYSPDTLRPVLEHNGFSIQAMEWMNLLTIPGWFLNGRVFKREAVPALQLKVYDALMPVIARLESRVRLPIGMNLFVVAEAL
jgi:SAM-dependent methyltransferase